MRGRPPLTEWHGTVSGYRNHHCKCDPCRAAHARNGKRYGHVARVDKATGKPANPMTVPGDLTRIHVLRLRASGFTLRQIAAEAKVSYSAVQRIAIGDRTRVHRRIAEALATVEPLPAPDPTIVDTVVVERLVTGADWRALGASRAERLAARARLSASHDKRLGLNGRERVAS